MGSRTRSPVHLRLIESVNTNTMKFELYEVWSEDLLGHQELVDTTSSIVEARRIAEQALDEGAESVIIYRETDDGDLEVVEEL